MTDHQDNETNNRSNEEGIIAPIESVIFRKAILGVVPIAFTLDSEPSSTAAPSSGKSPYWHPTHWWTHPLIRSVRFSDSSVVRIVRPKGDAAKGNTEPAIDSEREEELARSLAERLSKFGERD